ncbi:MAG: addiction module antitoxin [Thermoleophilia bacterium]|nr:addiction module antitoxin [Thermoleophilia bacterium]
MRKKLTITVAEDVYDGLHKVIGARNISMFLEALARPHVICADVDAAYAAMAADEIREREALEWVEGTMGDVADAWGNRDEAG